MAKLIPTEIDGLMFTALVSDSREEEEFEGDGLILGPPEELKNIVLPPKQKKLLFEELNRRYLFNANDLEGRRPELVTILHDIGVPKSSVNETVRWIQYYYQTEFYGEK
jgi:hypothetical protein